MAVKRIIAIFQKPDWMEVKAFLLSAERDDVYIGFETENQALVSSEDGRIHIIEVLSGGHDGFCEFFQKLLNATGTRLRHLVSRGSSYVESLRKLDPDCSFGLAPVWDWGSRKWPYLNWKVDQWRQFPGVEYILCIRLSPALGVHQYMLYTVNNRADPLPPMDPITIINPTNVTFNVC
ncbi:hypothetical protein Plhal304r1_c070g0158811 [Plasmopara halstedii]